MANLKDVIYLSNEDYETLVSTGTVTIDGDTLTYDENNVYITPEIVASSTQDGLMSASDKIKLDGVDTTYLPLIGGTLSLAGSDSLKIKRTTSNAGAYVRYYNNNQDTNYWMVGMKENGAFMFNYNGADKSWIDSSGNLYEGGTALVNKYGRLASANTWTGNNTFNGALSAIDGVSLSADSGDVAFSVSPSGIDLNSRYGVNIYSSERGYASASEPIRYASGVSPSDSSDLVPKSYVDNKTYATSIATSSGTNQLTLAFGTKYALTAGGTSYVFTMPSNPNTNQTVKAGSTTFGANAAVAITAGTRITVTPNATNNTITIATSATADSAITNAQIDGLF